MNRHSYVDYINKPYAYFYGIPHQRSKFYVPQNNSDNRTIIRTNQPAQITPSFANNNNFTHY